MNETLEHDPPLVEIKNLVIEAMSNDQPIRIVDQINLELKRGEILGLIGESGAGKSTLGLAAMGFARDGCKFTQGSIRFDGVDLLTLSPQKRRQLLGRKVSYVAQSAAASFNPAHKLIDQFTEGPLLHQLSNQAQAQADAVELYRKMLLPDPENIGMRYPHQVSGGQLQRAMTAMAMACRPDLIIFDEPTTALDVTTQIEVLETIRDIVRDYNTAAIYITHDLALVAQMADRIKIMLEGREVEQGKTADIMRAPTQDYTKSLWAVRQFKKAAPASPTIKESSSEIDLLRLENIDASYGKVKVLDAVDFNIKAGSTVAVVGESGSGKSTAARVITGLLPPKAGSVLYQGQALPASYLKRDKGQLQQIQMIYQMADTALNPKQKIAEIIGRPAAFYTGLSGKQLQARICELLELIELEPDHYLNRLPSELSGGQKQRIGIARALAAHPQLIICDEVTSALDQIVAEGILKLLDQLQRKLNLTYMFITHDLATVKAIADEVVVMRNGKVIEQDTKENIFIPPHDPYTELLLSCVPEMDPHWLDDLLKRRKGTR